MIQIQIFRAAAARARPGCGEETPAHLNKTDREMMTAGIIISIIIPHVGCLKLEKCHEKQAQFTLQTLTSQFMHPAYESHSMI